MNETRFSVADKLAPFFDNYFRTTYPSYSQGDHKTLLILLSSSGKGLALLERPQSQNKLQYFHVASLQEGPRKSKFSAFLLIFNNYSSAFSVPPFRYAKTTNLLRPCCKKSESPLPKRIMRKLSRDSTGWRLMQFDGARTGHCVVQLSSLNCVTSSKKKCGLEPFWASEIKMMATRRF